MSRMMVFALSIALALSPAAAGAQSSATPKSPAVPASAASAGPVDIEDAAVTAIVRELLQRLQSRTFDRACLEPGYSRLVSDQSIARTEVLLDSLGEPRRFDFLERISGGDASAYAYHVTLTRGALDILLILDENRKIAGVVFGIRLNAPVET